MTELEKQVFLINTLSKEGNAIKEYVKAWLGNYANQIIQQTDIIKTLIIAGITITVIIGVIILLNQQKIRKELRQLREMMENQDKPQE